LVIVDGPVEADDFSRVHYLLDRLPDVFIFHHPVHADLAAIGFLELIEFEIRPAFNQKNDIVDHIGIGYGDGQIFSRFKPRKSLIALDHANRPNYVPQIDFHKAPLY
jgi:hypothetical protein